MSDSRAPPTEALPLVLFSDESCAIWLLQQSLVFSPGCFRPSKADVSEKGFVSVEPPLKFKKKLKKKQPPHPPIPPPFPFPFPALNMR